MSRPVGESNVYYLTYLTPQPAPAQTMRRPGLTARLRTRVVRAAWRLRLMIADIRTAVRRPGGRLFADNDYPALLAGSVEALDRRPLETRRRSRLTAGPARVIDFESARGRRRPVTA